METQYAILYTAIVHVNGRCRSFSQFPTYIIYLLYKIYIYYYYVYCLGVSYSSELNFKKYSVTVLTQYQFLLIILLYNLQYSKNKHLCIIYIIIYFITLTQFSLWVFII